MKKKISLILALLMIFAMGTSVFATAIGENGGTTTPDTPAYSEVELTGAATTFSVTVPMVLPLNMDANGKITTASGNITNNSYGPVEITKEEITVNKAGTETTGWGLVSFQTNMSEKEVGTKVLGFCLNGNEISTDGTSFVFYDKLREEHGGNSGPNYTGGSRVIPGIHSLGNTSSYALNYRAKAPARSEVINNEVVAHVVFTFAWDKTGE